ncbi:FecR family protein [Sphingobium boeckii]|nr:FecR domain-containing protein [Sphingobium boeckii]
MDRQVREAAAAWVARLNARAVDSAVLEAFYEWRKDPLHARAYETADAHWRQAEALGDDSDIKAALAQALQAAPRGWARRPQILLAMACLVILALGASLFVLTRSETRFTTGVGEERVVQLEDGTRLHLNTDSDVAVDFSRSRRDVRLTRGEASFHVAHDSARPFVVHAALGAVTAVGTQFDMRTRADRLSVALTEGSVEIAPTHAGKTGNIRLTPGQAVSIDARGRVMPGKATLFSQWKNGRILFDRTPLSEAIAEVNRYTSRTITLSASDLAGETVNGGFDTGDVDAFVDAVTALYPLKAERRADGTIRLSR